MPTYRLICNIYPCGCVGLSSDARTLRIATQTVNQRLYGFLDGNAVSSFYAIGARIGFDPAWAAEFLSGCTAVVCYNDEIAARLVSCLTKLGLSVPGDVAVVSFDNSAYSEMSTPRVTSLSHAQYNVGRLAAEMLFRHLRGETCASALVPWALVEKESS